MIEFLVEDTRYRVHRFFFEDHSEEFAVKYKLPERDSGTMAYVRLNDVTTRDFEQLLNIFYPSTLASPYPNTKTVEDWTSILRLSTKWKFSSLRELAVQRLLEITSPIDKVVLGHTFDLPEWLPLAYAQLCERNIPLTVEEGKRLGELGHVGADIVTRLWQISHEVAPTAAADRNYTEVVKRVFELEDKKPEAPPIEAPPLPQAPALTSAFRFVPPPSWSWPNNANGQTANESEKHDVWFFRPPPTGTSSASPAPSDKPTESKKKNVGTKPAIS